jgi:hypothetical protein
MNGDKQKQGRAAGRHLGPKDAVHVAQRCATSKRLVRLAASRVLSTRRDIGKGDPTTLLRSPRAQSEHNAKPIPFHRGPDGATYECTFSVVCNLIVTCPLLGESG